MNKDTHNWSRYRVSEFAECPTLSISDHFLPKLRDHCGWGGRKSVRVRGDRRLQENSNFWTEQGSYTYELRVVVTAWTNPNMERGGRHQVPTLVDELLVIDSCWERKKPVFFKSVVPWKVNRTSMEGHIYKNIQAIWKTGRQGMRWI